MVSNKKLLFRESKLSEQNSLTNYNVIYFNSSNVLILLVISKFRNISRNGKK